MKKFMIFLLMAFLFLGTSQASNEFTSSSSDVGKSLRHWVSPSVGSSAYAKFKPFSSSPLDAASDLTDSIIRVSIVGVHSACPGQVITLTAVIENDYVGIDYVVFRRNGQPQKFGYDPNTLNGPRVVWHDTIPEREGLDSLILDYDVIVGKGSISCQTYMSPKHYVRVNSIHVLLDSVYVCDDDEPGMMLARVYSNGAEAPNAYVWYKADNTIVDTTFVPYKALLPGSYYVEPHFNWSACVTQSNVAAVVKTAGPADNHITMNDITALACSGNQVFAKLSGMVDSMGTPSYVWSLNGITIPGANDSILLFTPANYSDTTMYILKAAVTYSNYDCKTYTVTDTIKVLDNPTVAIYGNSTVCGADLSDTLYARTNGHISDANYTWLVDGVSVTSHKDTLILSELAASLTPKIAPYEISVSVTGGNGCSASSAPFMLYVNGAPVVHVSASADTVCKGTPVTVNANLENNNTPNLTYAWYKKVGTGTFELIPTATTASYTADVTDSTFFKVVVKQLGSECTSEDSVKVYVFPDAKPVKDLVLNLNDTAVCNGGQIALTLVDTANTNQYGEVGTYKWLVNGVEVDDAEGKTYTFIPEVTDVDSTIYNIVVNATYKTTCATIPASVDTTIAVYKRPTVTISGDPIVCNSDTVKLTANIHGVLGTTTYTWRVDGVDSVKDKDFKVQLDERDYQYNISVVVAPNTACETVSEVYPVLIGNDPTVAIGISAPTVCKNTEVTLTAHLGDYNMPNLTYQWYSKKYNVAGDSTAIAIGTSRELTIPVADTTKYTVVVKQVNSGCFAKGDTVINVFEETPEVEPVLVQASEYNVCYGSQVTFTAIDTANYKLFGSGTYQWSVNGVTVSGATDSIYTFVPATVDNDSINYTVAVRVDYNTTCIGRFAENDTMITVYRNPSVAIAGDPIVCDGSALNLTAVVHDTLTAPVASYLWRVDGVDSTTTAIFTSKLDVRDYPYELTVVLNAGTACEVVSDPFTVLIGSNPTAALEASDTIVCKGANVTLTAHLGDYNMPNLTYKWYRKTTGSFDSIPIGTSRVLTIPVDAKTEYFVKITQVNSECVAYSDTLTVNIYPEPAPLTPLILLASDTAICFGGEVSYAVIDSANIKNYGKGTYQWSVNGVNVAGATDSIYVFSPEAVDNDSTAYIVAVAVTYVTPCTLISDAIDTIVSVQRNPSVVISGDPVVCQDTVVDLYATVHDTLPGMQVSYLWRVDGVDSIQNTNHFHAKLDQRDYPYEITVVINAGTACESSAVYSVLIGNIPTVAIEASAPIVCRGDDVTLTAHIGDYNMPNLVYQWYYGKPDYSDTIAIPIGTSRILTVPVNDTTRYYVRVKQVNSDCEAWADTVINVFPKDPEVEPIELLASDSTVCIGGQIAFHVQDTTNRKNYFGSDSIPGAYRWFVNGFELMTVSGDHFMFSPAAFDLDTTNYVIEVEATYQTQCEVHVATAADTVTARSNPSVVINGDPMICDTTKVRLMAIVNDTLPGTEVSYLWRVDGVDSTSMNTNIFETNLPNRDYPYEVTVVIYQGSNCEVVSEPFYLYIEDQPEVVVTVDYDTVCQNQVVNLTAHLGNYNQANLTYQWFADDDSIYYGTESTVAYTITKPAGQTTHFKVIVTQLNSACQGTGFDSVYTFKNPTLDTILVTNLQDDISDAYSYHQYYGLPAYDVCEGASVQVTAWLRDESGNLYLDSTITYKWRRNGVVIEGVNEYRFMEQLAIHDHDQYKYVYTVEIDEPYYPNCYSIPTQVHSDTVKVRRNPVVIIGGEHFFCDRGETENNVLLNAWVDGAVDTGAIYRWYRDGMFEENPYHAQYGAMFLGSFRARYGYNYTFQVEVINGSGCSSWSDPFEVTIMAPPVINITPYADTVCTGGEVMLVSHLEDYNVIDYELQYQWYTNSVTDDNLIPGANEASYRTNVDVTTSYLVKVGYLVENSNMPACVAVDTTVVTVYDRPEIDSIIMSLTEICEGAQVQLTAVMDSVHQGVPGVPYIYRWYRNSELLPGNGSTIYDSPVTVDGNEQQFTYSVVVYQEPSRLMCESELFVSSQTLTVFPNPIVAIFGDQHVCYTDTIELVANIDTISNPVSTNVHYYWFESGAPIVNLNGDSAVLKYYGAAQDEPYRFTVQVERENSATGCRQYSYEYDVWVYNAPVANVTIVDTAVCEGAEVTVTAHLNQNTPEQINLEYQWYAKSAATADTFQLVPGATELTYTTTIFETTTFKFEVVHTLSGCFDIDSATINVYPIPVITEVVMSDTNVCEGSDMIITAVIDSTKGMPGYPYFYEWRRNGELLEGNTATIHDQPMTADGTTERYVYSAIAYQTPERMACYSASVNSAELTVFGNPRVAIFGDQHVCYTDTISLIANVDTFAYPVGDLHYIWYESGNMITNLNGDSKTLKYYAPAQDEPYRFTVQIERDNSEAACRSYSAEYDVWVYEAPVVNVTIVDETVCEGAEVTVTAHLNQNDPEQLNLEYQWYTKTSSDTDYVLVPGATALTYTTIVNDTTEFMFRVVHTLSGCFDTDSKTINVNPIPVVNYVSMSDTNVCEGAQVTIYADVDMTKGVPGMPYYFEWQRNGEPLPGNTQTIYDSPMTVDGNEQTFVYSVIAYQDPTRLACFSQSVESATLNVYPNPRVSISGDQHVCQTDSVFLYANVDTIGRPVGLLHYTWYESGRLRDNMAYGLGDSRFFSEYFYPQAEPYRFTVEVQRDNIAGGCRVYSEEFLVWVYEEPVVNITASETEVCVGGEVTLRANLNNYEFNYANDAQYQWYTVDTVEHVINIAINPDNSYVTDTIYTIEHNPIPGATTLFYTTTMRETKTYGFTATHNLSGCSDYDEITINVNDIPVIVSVENLSGQDTLCPGGRVELHATIEGGVPGGEVYTWYRNGDLMESTGENLIDYPLAVDNNVTMYIYEVVVKQNAAGCESVIDSLSTDTIWVVPNPTIELSGDPIVCDTTNKNIVITANVVSYVDTTNYGYTYQWYENNAPLAGENGLVLSVHRPYRHYPYSFNFEVKNAFGCTVLSEPFLVYVNDNPIVHIAADDTMICENGTVTLTADLYDQNAENLVYVWYINGDSIPGAYNTTYTTTLASTSTFTFKAYQRDSECAAISNEVVVNVVAAPVVNDITVVSVDTVVCEGHIVSLHANVTGGDNVDEYVYTWYKDNEIVEGVTGADYTDYPLSVDNDITTHIYNVTVAQVSSACFSLYDTADVVTITVRPNPRYTIYGDADVCEVAAPANNIVLNARTTDPVITSTTAYTYEWYEEDTLVGTNSTTLEVNRPYRTEPYIFKMKVVDAELGCTTETEEFLVYVSASPIVNVTSTEDTICTNGVVTLTANIYDQNAEYLAFQWYKTAVTEANKILGANDATYTTAVAETTKFIVVVDQLTTGCQTIASTTVTVNNIPVIVSVENLSGQDTLCPGGRVELHATVNGGVSGGEVYTWYRNGVELESTGENLIDYPSIEDNNVAQYIYEVTVRQTAAACQSIITPASTDTLWIVPNPTIALAGDPIVCDTTLNNIHIDAHIVSYLNTNYTYQWYEDNEPLAGQTTTTLTYHKPYRHYPYSFTLAVMNQYGCTVESEPFLVYVNDNPVVGITADDTLICENGIVTLTADLYDQNADNMVYKWYKDNVEIEGAYDLTYSTTLAQSATFKFYAYQRDSQCAAYSNEVTVNVVPVPVVDSISVVSNDLTICEGHIVSLHANVTGGDNVDEYVYTWYKDNEIVNGATGADFTDYPLSVDNDITTHIYNVTVAQVSNACFSLYDTADVVTITVRPNPRYTIYGDTDVCDTVNGENNITLNARTTDPVISSSTAYTYEWYEEDTLIATGLSTTLSISRPYRTEPYIFKMIAKDAEFECTSETAEFEVYVHARPVVVIAVDQDSICEGGYVTLTSTLNQTEDGILYQWQNNVSGTWSNIEGAVAPIYVTPALTQTTTYRLTVVNTITGCKTNSINDITVTVKPSPVIDILSVTAGVVCNGGEVTLTATGAEEYEGLGDVQYQWYRNGQAIFGADQNVYTTSPLTVDGDMTTYTFGVQVTMSNSGCVSNIDTATVTVYADPTVTITYDNGLTLCEGGATTLTANPHHAFFTDFTYQWYLHGQPIPDATNATYVVENLAASADAYEYNVLITVVNGTQNGCSAMANESVFVTIVNDPTAYITASENAICEGGTASFTVHVNDGVEDTYNPYTYAWYSNVTGSTVLSTEATFTTSAADTANLYVYFVDVTSEYGCNVRVSDTLRIVEDPIVTIAVKLGEDTVVCDGGRTTLVATVTGGLGEASYQWYKNGYPIPGATNNEIETDELYANVTSAYTVSVTQTGVACTATSTQFNVNVYEAIEVALTTNSEFNCVGGSVTLTATTTNGIPDDVLTYQWYRNGNPINGATGDQYVTDENLVAGHYEYQVEVSSSISGCHVALSGTIGITVEGEPTVTISSNVETNSICQGGDITLTANVIYATNPTEHTNTYTYTWKWWEGTTLRSVQTSDPHYTLPTTMTAGSYNFFVEISSNDGLGCDASSQGNLFNVVIKPVPTVILTATSDATCYGGDVTFNAVVIPSNLSGIFYWNVNGTQVVSSNASITVNDMAIGTNNISVVFAPNDAQIACNSVATSITHVVNAAPVVTIQATDPTRLAMCVGGTITISATSTGVANSADHYVWTVDGLTQYGNNGSTFTTQLNTPGIHTFSAMLERPLGCNSQYSTPIAVTVAEQPAAQVAQIAGYTEMCAGGQITLMANVPNYATVNNGVANNSVHGTYTYTWYRDGAEFTTNTNVTVDNNQITETLNTPASYTYSVAITAGGYNCQAAHATLDHQIKVVPDPSWSVNQVNPTEMCIGGIVTLNAEVTGGVENQQAGRIQWYKTFGGVETEVAGLGGLNTDIPEAAGVYSYVPKYIDYIGAGCNIADATATQVTVNALPTASFTSGQGTVICGHDYQSFATLNITLTGTAPFTFTIMNMTTGEQQTIVTSLTVYPYPVHPDVTSIYRIISVSDANGCIGTLDQVEDAVVKVSDVQIAAESVVAACGNYVATIPLQINATDHTVTTFTATLPDGSTQTGAIVFDAYTQQHYVEVQMPAVAGDYMVNIEVDGCSGDVLVTVPADDVTMGVSETLVDQRWDDVVVVNNNPDNNGGYKFTSYQWYKNGEPIEGATEQLYQEVGGLGGEYSVELDGIRVSDGAHVHFITCGKYFDGNAKIKVYPVPANTTQEVTIELNMTDEELEGAILDIYDVRGAHVKSLSNLSPITKVGNFGAQGSYFGRIITGTNEIKTVKFIIVK